VVGELDTSRGSFKVNSRDGGLPFENQELHNLSAERVVQNLHEQQCMETALTEREEVTRDAPCLNPAPETSCREFGRTRCEHKCPLSVSATTNVSSQVHSNAHGQNRPMQRDPGLHGIRPHELVPFCRLRTMLHQSTMEAIPTQNSPQALHIIDCETRKLATNRTERHELTTASVGPPVPSNDEGVALRTHNHVGVLHAADIVDW
jgi:hypothetical protein